MQQRKQQQIDMHNNKRENEKKVPSSYVYYTP